MNELALLAKAAVARAIRRGELIRPILCEQCNQRSSRSIEAHHHNGYDIEHHLDVKWLCTHCHKKIHTSRLGGLATARKLTRAERVAAAYRATEAAKLKIPKSKRVEVARKAGLASVAKLTPEEHSALGRKAAAARWQKHRESKDRK